MADLRQRLLEALVEALTLTQQRSGRTASKIDQDTIPFLDLDKFDSHNGVEVEILLSERIGIEIDDIPFHQGRRGTRELRVGEIVDALLKKYGRMVGGAPEPQSEIVTN